MVADGPELPGASGRGRLRVVIVGGGVGALEAMLALRDLAEERVEITLLCPESEFRYRPASVAVPFGRGQVHRFPLLDMAAAAGARLVTGSLARVQATAEGALTFRGEQDADAVRDLLRQLEHGVIRRVAFALPRGATWPLPLYELALLTATHVPCGCTRTG